VKWCQSIPIADEVITLCAHATTLLCTYIAYLVTLILYKHIIMPRWQVSDCACSTTYRRGKYELHPAENFFYELRPKVSALRVSVAYRVVNHKHDDLCPAISKELYQLRPKVSASCVFVVFRVVNRTRMSCIERYGYSKCPTIWRFLRSFIVLYFIHNYMHTYRIVEWYRQFTIVISIYCL
jgi:hypothetical protein